MYNFFALLVLIVTIYILIKSDEIHPILIIGLMCSIFIWYLIPGFISLFYSYDELCTALCFGIEYKEYEKIYFKEVICFAISIISAIYLVNFHGVKGSNQQSINVNPRMLYLCMGGYFFMLVNKIYNQSGDYLEINSADRYDEQAGSAFAIVILSLLFNGLIVGFARFNLSKNCKIILFLLLCVDSIYQLYTGARIYIVTPVALLMFVFLPKIKYKIISGLVSAKDYFLKTVVLLVAGIGLFNFIVLPLSRVIEDSRGNSESTVTIKDIKSSENDGAKMLFTKFNSFSAGASLEKLRRDGEAINLTPYYGSIFIFVPRFIYKDRPVTGSADGTIYGHPSKVVPAANGILSESMNVGVSPLSINIWFLDWLGYIVFVIVSATYIYLINNLLKNNDIFKNILGVYAINIPTFLFIGSSDFVIKQMVLMLFVYFLYFTVRFLYEKK